MEKDIERATVRALKKFGFHCPKLNSEKGIPDRLVLGPKGIIFFVEFKFGRNKLKPHQKAYKRKLKKLGFTVLVAYDKETVINWAKAKIKEVSEIS
jgi:hypothetical protein